MFSASIKIESNKVDYIQYAVHGTMTKIVFECLLKASESYARGFNTVLLVLGIALGKYYKQNFFT